MPEIVWERTGDRPLAFDGEVLVSERFDQDKEEPKGRDYQIQIARTVGGQYVAQVSYSTTWKQESNFTYAFQGDDPEEIVIILQGFDPMKPVVGFPPGKPFEERQRRLEQILKIRWDELLSKVFAVFGPEKID